MKTLYTILALCFFVALADAQVEIKVDPTKEIKEISPYIYGRNNNLSDDPAKPLSDSQWQLYKDAGLTFFRESGGNNSTKYNWRRKLSSHPDWYNNVYAHDWDYAAVSLQENMPEVKGMWSFQLLGYVAKTNAANFPDWDYQQAGNEPRPHENWCGGGDYTQYLEEWPADSTTGILEHWFDELGLNKEQFQYWNMDNEPEVWNGTHDDVVPDGITPEEYIAKYVAVAVSARMAFPGIKIVGPVFNNEWQWYNWQNNYELKNAEGKRCSWVEYFIMRIAEEQERTGLRLVDVLDFHFYPEFGSGDDVRGTTLQLHRIFYDTNYEYPLGNGVKILDNTQSDWNKRSKKEYIWKRANDYLNKYMGENHGVTMGLSEVGNFYDGDPNVIAASYASFLGTFAENNVEIFSTWTEYTGQWEVMHLFSRYAGTTSVTSTSSLDSLVSAYSSVNATKDTLTIILVNRDVDNSRAVSASLQNATTEKTEVSFYRLSNLPKNQETFISKDNNALEKGSVEISNKDYFSMTLPKLSVTAVQVPLQSPVGNRDLQNNNKTTFDLFPNPATSQTKVVAEGFSGDVTITVTDMLARTLKTIQANSVGGKVEITIDLSAFENGVYFVKIQNSNLTKIRKLIIK